ncbi:hypothetical protein K9K77_03185 [Candidatus Babeliales bacterium]|nr:hypothetical protein [Candidatus Babeliales bacterium]
MNKKIITIMALVGVYNSFSAEAFNFVETAVKDATHFVQKTAQALTGNSVSSEEESEEEAFEEVGTTETVLLNSLEEATKNPYPQSIHNLIAEWEMLLTLLTTEDFITFYRTKIESFDNAFTQSFADSLSLSKHDVFMPFSQTPWVYFLTQNYSTLTGLNNGIQYLHTGLKKETELWRMKSFTKKNEKHWKEADNSRVKRLSRIAFLATQNQHTFFPFHLAQNLNVIAGTKTTQEMFEAALKGLLNMQRMLQEIIHGQLSLFIYGSYCDSFQPEGKRKSHFPDTIDQLQKVLKKQNITKKTIEATIKNLKKQQEDFMRHDSKVAPKEVQELLRDALERDGLT